MPSRVHFPGRLLGAVVLLAGMTSALSACQHIPDERHSTGSPDQRLAIALARLDTARADGRNTDTIFDDEEVIVDPGTVRSDIEQLAVAFPRHVPTLLVNADLAYEAGENEKAQAYCDRVLRLQPENAFAGIIRARIALEEGNVHLARRILQRQLETTPESPQLYEVLAGVEFLDGRLADAEMVLSHAEALGADRWRLEYHRGLIAERRGQRDVALAHFEACLQERPQQKSARAHLTLLQGGVLPLRSGGARGW